MNNAIETGVHTIAPTALPHSQSFLEALITRLKELREHENINALTLTFKDTSYSPYEGGYHPVEIRLSKLSGKQPSTATWQLEYITDFAYQGACFPELVKEIDFDFANGCFYSAYFGWKTFKGNSEAVELYQLWESNFVDYLQMDAFDSISVKVD